MADKPQRRYEIDGNDRPESMAKYAFDMAKGMLEERKDRKQAIIEMAKGFPPFQKIIRYSEGLGWTGAVSKRWSQFSEVYADFMQVANLAYDKFGNEYDELFPDLEKEERIWYMMCDKLGNVVEDVMALLYEMLPEIKREVELDTESKERMTFIDGLKEQKPKRTTLSVDDQRRIVEDYDRR